MRWLRARRLGAAIYPLGVAAYFVAGFLLSTGKLTGDEAKNVMIWLALAGTALPLLWLRLERSAAIAALFVLTVLSVANYWRWGPDLAASIDAHDPIHYYLGSKYFAEVNNFDLYPALAAVDADNRRWIRPDGRRYYAMTAEGFERLPYTHALEQGKALRDHRFTPERWREFEQDVLYFQTLIGRRHFGNVLGDKGFNATPAWCAYARPIAQLVPVEWLKALCMLDVVLLAIALGAVGWAYGYVALLFSLFYLSVTISLRWLTPGAVFLRYDWLAALVLAMCLLKCKRPMLAGIFAGFSGVLRYFPIVWIWGPASKAALKLLEPGRPFRERFDRPLVTLGLAFLVSLGACQAAATWSVGTKAVSDHWSKINHHISPEMISSKRPGLLIAATYRGESSPDKLDKERRAEMREHKTAITSLGVALMCLLAWGLRKRPDDEAFAFGYIPFFLLTTATYYYQICRLTLLVLHASDLSKLRNRIGLAALFGMEVWSNWVTTRYPNREVLWCGWLSWSITAYALLMIGWLLYEARSPSEPLLDKA